HKFRKPGPDDARSPCPALNAMANHGYLPRNGRNLTGTILTNALIDCYNLSYPLAAFLSWGGVLLLGQVGTLSLSDLARHNRIEHDASLTHANTPFSDDYAPKRNCPVLYEKFLRDARKGGFGADDIARARVRREDVEGPREGTEVTSVQQEIARGEVALVLQIFGGKEFRVPVEVVKSWWGENKLPEGWKPTRLTTLQGTISWSTTIRHAMDSLRKTRTYADAE
ncbi:Cloroperoxidase, partial [Fomitiporia mediterranea MF3/22]|uniref:Cloroperoxidase n=1 Tax=Fomitiporia mediterranea (strain MF3/22) TaxID=694068 RepID=UPI00044074B7